MIESDIAASTKGKMAKIHLHTREYSLVKSLTREPLEHPLSSDEETIPRHHTKSGLRPRKAAKKGKSYKGNSTSAEKRKQEFDRESDISSRHSKRRTMSLDVSEQSSQGDESTDPADANDRMELPWKRGPSDSDPPVAIITQLDLSTEANAPGDVWRCPAFGCMEIIYGASRYFGKSLIDNHIERHRNDDTGDHMDIVMREMKKCNLPVK
jgi:hypothetical protein